VSSSRGRGHRGQRGAEVGACRRVPFYGSAALKNGAATRDGDATQRPFEMERG